jgi:hypothetical protein
VVPLLALAAWYLADPPNASDLLARAVENYKAQTDARAHYIYREHAEHTQPDGTINDTQDYEWIFLEGSFYRKLTAVNGKPLSGRAARSEERKFQMTAAQRRQDAQRHKPNRLVFTADITPATVLRVMRHRLGADETINGRAAWVVHSEPLPDFESTTAEEIEAKAYRYTYWIDKEDGVIVQERYKIYKPGAKVLPGSSQTTTYTKIADSVWLPSYRQGEYYSGPPRPVSHWCQTHRFTDYRKFGSESTMVFQ